MLTTAPVHPPTTLACAITRHSSTVFPPALLPHAPVPTSQLLPLPLRLSVLLPYATFSPRVTFHTDPLFPVARVLRSLALSPQAPQVLPLPQLLPLLVPARAARPERACFVPFETLN
jgi:hypothetical protein